MIDLSICQLDTEAEEKQKEKFINFFYLMHFWMKALENEKTLSSFFIKNRYDNTAIYGLGLLGKHLKDQLEKESFPIMYIIEKDVIIYNDTEYDLTKYIDIIPVADIIVVTPLMEYTLIKNRLEKLTNSKIVSLEEVILSL